MVSDFITNLQSVANNRRRKAFSNATNAKQYPTEEEVIKFYHSNEWRQMRQAVLERDHGIDQWELTERGRLIPGDTVHHIVEVREHWELRNDIDNLETISKSNHNREHIEKGNKKLNKSRYKTDDFKVKNSVKSRDIQDEIF